MSEEIEEVELADTTRHRYLNYALSVITSRALPDIRDGLKPVQRRILYAMHQNLRLLPDTKHRKSAAVVGEVMAKYHPHGDQSIYDAMVRMAQDFSLRYPLVDGQGNFGSLDGDGAAAMRYTEAKLRHVAVELLSELRKETVDYRQNYDGTSEEPVVLPAQVPHLLINGATGIAVGMATNVPPHNLKEVVSALIALIDQPELTIARIVGRIIKGPDFPTGGTILNSRDDLLRIYETGQGPIEMRGEYEVETEGRKKSVVITSIPYGVNKATLIGDIADHIRQNKVPQLVDARDESTDVIRIVLELKRGASADAAMAYLYKRTVLQTRFHVNITALLPTDNPEVCRPQRVNLLEMLEYFRDFRYEVTSRRLNFDLRVLEKRIHILRGFAIIFDALDEAIRIIRASDGKADSRDKLMARFELDFEQAEAVLETKLYRLAKMEMDLILSELAEKEAAAAAIRTTLSSKQLMWELIRTELEDIRNAYGDRRRTKVIGPQEEVEFTEEDYIVAEDTFVMVTREGWFKRQKSYSDMSAVRVREGDELGWVVPVSTKESVIFFTDAGKAYTMRAIDVTLTTGYGEPIQTRFDFGDGERIIGVVVSDKRSLPVVTEEMLAAVVEGEPAPPFIIAVSRDGKTLRCPVKNFEDPSTRSGRLYMRLNKKRPDDGVVAVFPCRGDEIVSLATRSGRYLLFQSEEAKTLSGPGKGVQAIKLAKDDFVLGFVLTTHRMHGLKVETNRGREEVIRPNKFTVTGRGNKGRELIRVGYIASVEIPPVEIVWGAVAVRDDDEDEDDSLDAPPDNGQAPLFADGDRDDTAPATDARDDDADDQYDADDDNDDQDDDEGDE